MQIKVHETDIDPGLNDTVHEPSFIDTQLVSQERITDAKVPDATRITDINEDFFEGRCQDVPSHRTFNSKDRYSDVNTYDLSKIWRIGLGASTMMLKATTQRVLRSAIMPISRQYRADRMFEELRTKGEIFIDKISGRYKSPDGNRYAQVFSKKSLSGQGLREFIGHFWRYRTPIL